MLARGILPSVMLARGRPFAWWRVDLGASCWREDATSPVQALLGALAEGCGQERRAHSC
jgi:hypothetical protein